MSAGRLHILVVDDDPSVREALSAALSIDHIVHEAAGRADALDLLRGHPVTAIILDAVLSEESGLDLVPSFRALSSAPILVLTGHSSEDLVIRALRAGVDEYLKKPISLPDLRAALARLVVRRTETAGTAARVREYLDTHLAKPIRFREIATRLGLSEGYLRKLFRDACGKTPQGYLKEARVRRACDLLAANHTAIADVARLVGFRNVAAFRRAFTHLVGIAPLKFSRQEQTHQPPPVPDIQK